MVWTVVLVACALCCAWASVLTATRGLAVTRALAVGMAGAALWSAAAAVLSAPAGPTTVVVMRLLTTSGALAVACSSYWLSRAVQDPHRRMTRVDAAVLWGAPTAVMTALLTNPWHQLAYVDELTAAPPGVRWGDGPLYLLLVAVIGVPATLSMVHLAQGLVRSPVHYRPHVRTVLLTGVAVSAAVVASLALSERAGGAELAPHVDLVPVGLAVAALAIVHGVLRRRLLAVVPLARAQVVEDLPDAVIVVDAGGLVIDVNASARALLARLLPAARDAAADVLGRPLAEALPFLAPVTTPTGGGGGGDTSPLPGLHLDVRTSTIRSSRGAVVGRAVLLRDVSEVVERRLAAERTSERLADEASRDPLTGLLNRRGLHAAAAVVSEGAPLAVAILDVDHFKSVNDTHGHDAGDAVLTTLAGVLVDAVAPHSSRGAVAARLGGEEFALLLPGLGADAAARVAEGVLAAVRAATTSLPALSGPVEVRVTASAGVSAGACADAGAGPGSSASVLMREADGALYAAKSTGRDRVVVASAPADAPRTVAGA